MSFFDVDHPLETETVGSWSNEVTSGPLTPERTAAAFRVALTAPRRQDPFAILSPKAFDTLMQLWQRHPTRRHFYLCHLHQDCRRSEAMGHACWVTQGRAEGHAMGFRETSRRGMKRRPWLNQTAHERGWHRRLRHLDQVAGEHFDRAFGEGAADGVRERTGAR